MNTARVIAIGIAVPATAFALLLAGPVSALEVPEPLPPSAVHASTTCSVAAAPGAAHTRSTAAPVPHAFMGRAGW